MNIVIHATGKKTSATNSIMAFFKWRLIGAFPSDPHLFLGGYEICALSVLQHAVAFHVGTHVNQEQICWLWCMCTPWPTDRSHCVFDCDMPKHAREHPVFGDAIPQPQFSNLNFIEHTLIGPTKSYIFIRFINCSIFVFIYIKKENKIHSFSFIYAILAVHSSKWDRLQIFKSYNPTHNYV